jgi:outer membrane protein OmpA-like peptidoglycan-associated protein
MYIVKDEGIGQVHQVSDCSGWEKDPESFSKIIAEHYVRTELGLFIRGKSIWCRADGKLCEVTFPFPFNITVMVSLVHIPSHVIARQAYIKQGAPRREFIYSCTPEGNVIFSPRNKQGARIPQPGRRTKSYTQVFGELSRPPTPVSQSVTLAMRPRPFLVLDSFRFNKTLLNKLHKERISSLANHIVKSWRTSQLIKTVHLVGHTDPTGTESYNLKLASNRALEVKKRLIDEIEDLQPGLSKQINIWVESLGKTQPIASNRTKEGRAHNRRVEVFLSPPEKLPTPPTSLAPTKAVGKIDLSKEAKKAAEKVVGPARPETPAEQMNRILTTPVPTLPSGRSFKQWFDETLKELGVPLRDKIWEAILGEDKSLASSLLDRAGVRGEAKEAFLKTLEHVLQHKSR